MAVRSIDADRLLRVLESNFGHTGGAAVMRQLVEMQPTLTPPNEPLTIEQLREMVENDGEIIGTPIIVAKNGILLHGVLDSRVDYGICASTGAHEEWLKEQDYGKTWLAYTYPPAHIDWEEWMAEWEWFDEEIGSPLEGSERDWGWRCSKCGHILPDNFDNPDSPPKMKYCSSCGRAMTPEAWDELEKRMKGLGHEIRF